MSELQAWVEIDEQERERVRNALRRYMQDEGIGTPALRDRIIETYKPRHRDIPLSTLQRFIARKHHTQDHHVALCQAFVKELEHYQEGRDVALFGDALASFFPLRWPEHADSAEQGPDRLCGRYAASTHKRAEDTGKVVWSEEESSYVVPYSKLTFSRDGNASYLRAQETITNIGLDYPFSQEQTKATYTYEGVFAAFGSLLRLILRNNLTRQPRFHELRETTPGTFEGRAREASFLKDMQKVDFIRNNLACLLRREPERDE